MKAQLGKSGAQGDELLQSVLAVLTDLSSGMDEMRQGLLSHERSIAQLAVGELECPRLYVVLPVCKSDSRLRQLLRPKELLQDHYKLVFLDSVTGTAAKCATT